MYVVGHHSCQGAAQGRMQYKENCWQMQRTTAYPMTEVSRFFTAKDPVWDKTNILTKYFYNYD